MINGKKSRFAFQNRTSSNKNNHVIQGLVWYSDRKWSRSELSSSMRLLAGRTPITASDSKAQRCYYNQGLDLQRMDGLMKIDRL